MRRLNQTMILLKMDCTEVKGEQTRNSLPSSDTPTICGCPGSPGTMIGWPAIFNCSINFWFSSRSSRISFSVGLSLTTALVLMAFALSAKKQCIVQIKRVASNQKHLLLIQRYNCIFNRVGWVESQCEWHQRLSQVSLTHQGTRRRKPWEMVYKMVNGSGCAIVLWAYLENSLETKIALCEDKDGHLTETQCWQCLIKIDVSRAQGSDLPKKN